MTDGGGLTLGGTDLTVLAGMFAVLTGAISALWFAYSRGMQARIDTQVAQTQHLQQIVLSALALVIRIFDHANGHVITAADRAELDQLRAQIKET